jgi:hypothetical protein
MNFKWNFHPISYSITPRLSPFEATRIVSTFKRLAGLTDDPFWDILADKSYQQVKQWITENGGLSEGVFPINGTLRRLPMEQTFATVELMRSCLHYAQPKPDQKKKGNNKKKNKLKWKVQDKMLALYHQDEQIFSFDNQTWTVSFIKDASLNDTGITISLFNPYKTKNRAKSTLKQRIRGPAGKYLLGISELKYVTKGVFSPKPLIGIHLGLFCDIPKTHTSVTVDGNKAHCICETSLHRISATLTISQKNDDLIVHFSPVTIKVLFHDLNCSQVLFPLIGSELVEKKQDELIFKGFSIKNNFPKILDGHW